MVLHGSTGGLTPAEVREHFAKVTIRPDQSEKHQNRLRGTGTMTPDELAAFSASAQLEDQRTAAVEKHATTIRTQSLGLSHVVKLRERAVGLVAQLEDARVRHGRATVEADNLAASVREVMLAGGNFEKAERDRDLAATSADRLHKRVEDLAAAAEQAREQADAAEVAAIRQTAGRALPSARTELDTAAANLASVKERHARELEEAVQGLRHAERVHNRVGDLSQYEPSE